jgi:DNA-binding response OmpR family regulator
LLLQQKMSNKTVLLVDRNISYLKNLSDALLFQGYNVVTASDAREALDLAVSIEADLIIIDELLSQKQELVKSLRFTKGLENVSLIVLGDTVENTV